MRADYRAIMRADNPRSNRPGCSAVWYLAVWGFGELRPAARRFAPCQAGLFRFPEVMPRQRPREKLLRPASEDGGELQTKSPGAFLGNHSAKAASNHCAIAHIFWKAQMQTFLPYPDFTQSLACLDRARLGKQRVEAKQILLALTEPTYGWQSHPAVSMWRGFEPALAAYGRICCEVWQDRGYSDSLWSWFYERGAAVHVLPRWLGNAAFHASHRSNLLRKDPVWYGRYSWTESPDLPYVWPEHFHAIA